jgi:Tol biopolymer transport system component
MIALDMSDGTVANSRIVIVDVETGKARNIGAGAMPSFSADGSRLALTASGRGVITMNSNGGDIQTVDVSGWGAQWSPDGKSIAYGKQGSVWIWDVATKQSRNLLRGDLATRYSYTYWNLGWSHDSKSIAFKGRRRDDPSKDELVVVQPAQPENAKVILAPLSGDVTDYFFSPDNNRVIIANEIPPHQGAQLHAIDWKNPGAPEFLGITIPGHLLTGAAWSPDGKTIAATTQQSPSPVNWGNEKPIPE